MSTVAASASSYDSSALFASSPDMWGLSAVSDDDSGGYLAPMHVTLPRSADGLGGSVGGDSHTPVHLGMLWEILEARDSARINRVMGREEDEEWRIPRDQMSSSHNRDTGSRDLLILQATLLSLLIVMSFLWAMCCKKRCIGDTPLTTSLVSRRVAELARKISSTSARDLPPSYSRVDLTEIGLSINDHFNPPPSYDRAVESASSVTNGDYIANAVHPVDLTRNCSSSSILTLWETGGSVSPPNSLLPPPRPHSTEPPSLSCLSELNILHLPKALKGEYGKKKSTVSLPPGILLNSGSPKSRSPRSSTSSPPSCGDRRKRSVKSLEGNHSRKVSFVNEVTGMSISRVLESGEERMRKKLEEAEENGELSQFVAETTVILEENEKKNEQ